MFYKTGDRSYLNAFGKLRFQNELHELRRKLGSAWYDKLNGIEEVVVNADSLPTTVTDILNTKVCCILSIITYNNNINNLDICSNCNILSVYLKYFRYCLIYRKRCMEKIHDIKRNVT